MSNNSLNMLLKHILPYTQPLCIFGQRRVPFVLYWSMKQAITNLIKINLKTIHDRVRVTFEKPEPAFQKVELPGQVLSAVEAAVAAAAGAVVVGAGLVFAALVLVSQSHLKQFFFCSEYIFRPHPFKHPGFTHFWAKSRSMSFVLVNETSDY